MSKKYFFISENFTIIYIGTVPNVETDYCLGSEGNRVSMGEGGEGRFSPPEEGKDKQSVPNKGRGNMDEDEEGHSSRT